MYALPGGGFSSVPPASAKLQIALSGHCFVSDSYSVGDRGLHRVDEAVSGQASGISMPRYLGYIADAPNRLKAADPTKRDLALKSYVSQRKGMVETAHRYFGQPGLEVAQAAYASAEHVAVVSAIRDRLADPSFIAALSPLDRAEYELLTSTPDQFVTCVARKSIAFR